MRNKKIKIKDLIRKKKSTQHNKSIFVGTDHIRKNNSTHTAPHLFIYLARKKNQHNKILLFFT